MRQHAIYLRPILTICRYVGGLLCSVSTTQSARTIVFVSFTQSTFRVVNVHVHLNKYLAKNIIVNTPSFFPVYDLEKISETRIFENREWLVFL